MFLQFVNIFSLNKKQQQNNNNNNKCVMQRIIHFYEMVTTEKIVNIFPKSKIKYYFGKNSTTKVVGL